VGTSVRCLRGALLVAALGTVLFAQEPPPAAACTKETQGKLWPAEANSDHQVARRLIQAGELYMCSATTRTRRWELVGIHIRAIEAASSRKKAQPASNDRASIFAFHAWLARQ
jgi:hypothetical protein